MTIRWGSVYLIDMKNIVYMLVLSLFVIGGQSVYAQSVTDVKMYCLSIPYNLAYGSRDVDGDTYVSKLQAFLQRKGFLAVNPTGFFGTATLSAVKSFQLSEGISATGYVGPLTRERIEYKTCRVSPESVMDTSNENTTSLSAQTTAPTSLNTTVATIDTLDFFLSNYPNKGLTGTHPMNNMVSGQTAYYTKWSTDSFEMYTWDNEYIYLREDHSGSPVPGSYIFTPGRWLKRNMSIGESIDMSSNRMTSYAYSANTCSSPTETGFPYKITLEQRNQNYNLGGDLGVQDVIVIRYDYQSGTGDFERSYYSREWGFVKWELYRNNALIQTSIFNMISPSAPIVPNTAGSCFGKATTTPTVVTPTIPTTANGFISHLYSCVLNNNNPDSAGFNFWLQNFQSGALSVKNLYTQFFDVQNKLATPFTTDAFIKTLYRCPLFREVDGASYTNVLNGLNNGSLTRSGLVQTVLGAAEFAPIETKLKALATQTQTPTITRPTVALTSTVVSATDPGSITLSWSATNSPTSCTASGGYGTTWSGAKASSGSLTVSGYPAGTYTFTLSCINSAGTGSSSTSFTVSAKVPVTPITVSLVPYRSTITDFPTTKDNSVYWTTTGNPTSCTPWGASPWNTAVISPISSGYQYQGIYGATGTYTYGITCVKAGVPNATASFTVSVTSPTVVAPTAPALPTDASKFISHLYACVLNNNNPDSAGFNFWLTDFRNKAVTVKSLYTQFFGYQKDVVPAISHTDFAQKLYQCMLFRNPSSTDVTNVVNGLNSGSLTRSGLVQTVLGSTEFATILPKLEQLK